MKFHWRKWNNIIHRDLGYLFVGMSIIYGLSGIALNHMDDWNPNYIIKNKPVQLDMQQYGESISKQEALQILSKEKLQDNYKSHYSPGKGKVKIFIDGGTLLIDMQSGKANLEIMKRRPVFYSVNFMHYNPGKLWKWYSDIYAGALIILAITGLFVLRGKKGIKGRGAVLGIIGIIIPLILILMYI